MSLIHRTNAVFRLWCSVSIKDAGNSLSVNNHLRPFSSSFDGRFISSSFHGPFGREYSTSFTFNATMSYSR